MKIVVISQPKIIENEHLVVQQLFEAGLDTFHIRKPRLRTQQLHDFIEKIPPQFHNRLIIHTHHRLAAKFNLQ